MRGGDDDVQVCGPEPPTNAPLTRIDGVVHFETIPIVLFSLMTSIVLVINVRRVASCQVVPRFSLLRVWRGETETIRRGSIGVGLSKP